MLNINRVVSHEAGQGYNLSMQRVPHSNSKKSRLKLRASPGEAMWDLGFGMMSMSVFTFLMRFTCNQFHHGLKWSSGQFCHYMWAPILQCPGYLFTPVLNLTLSLFDGNDIVLRAELVSVDTVIPLLTEYKKNSNMKSGIWCTYYEFVHTQLH